MVQVDSIKYEEREFDVMGNLNAKKIGLGGDHPYGDEKRLLYLVDREIM